MGTSNFYNKNASSVFAVLMNEEVNFCTDCGNFHYEEVSKCDSCDSENLNKEYKSVEDFEVEDFKDNIKDSLQNSKYDFRPDVGNNSHNLRSFEGTILGSVIEDKTILNVSIEVQITCILRSGYYEGANLDWEITHYIDGYEHDVLDFAIDEWEHNALQEYNQGLVSIQRKNAKSYIENTTNELVEFVESIYKQYSTELGVVARFSNGETMYAVKN